MFFVGGQRLCLRQRTRRWAGAAAGAKVGEVLDLDLDFEPPVYRVFSAFHLAFVYTYFDTGFYWSCRASFYCVSTLCFATLLFIASDFAMNLSCELCQLLVCGIIQFFSVLTFYFRNRGSDEMLMANLLTYDCLTDAILWVSGHSHGPLRFRVYFWTTPREYPQPVHVPPTSSVDTKLVLW